MENFLGDYWLCDFAQIASTQDEAKKYHASPQEKKSVVFLTGRQTAGYGRHGRLFIDSHNTKPRPETMGENFFMSLYLPHFSFLPQELPSLSLVIGLCLFDSLIDFLGEKKSLYLKWPNDLLINGKKMGGILIEKIDDAIIIGVGINIHHAPDGFGWLGAATDKVPSNKELARIFLEILDNKLPTWQQNGFMPFHDDYEKKSLPRDKAIEFTAPGQPKKMTGLYRGVTANGALRVVVDDVEKIIAVADIL